MDDQDCSGHWTGQMNGSNESVKFGFKIDLKIFMDRISKFCPDHDIALVDIVYHCCFRSVRWRVRYIATNQSKSRSKIDLKKIMDRISNCRWLSSNWHAYSDIEPAARCHYISRTGAICRAILVLFLNLPVRDELNGTLPLRWLILSFIILLIWRVRKFQSFTLLNSCT